MRLLTPKNRPYVLFALWLGIIVTVSLWLVEPPERPRSVASERVKEKWSLPKANASAEVETVYKQVAPWDLFHNQSRKPKKTAPPPPPSKKTAPPPPPSKPRVVWRLSGIIGIGDEQFAVIGTKKEHRQYKTGDLLPNDENLLKIETDRIRINDSGKEKTVKLFDLSNKAEPQEKAGPQFEGRRPTKKDTRRPPPPPKK